MNVLSPLRYPGGKAQYTALVEQVAACVDHKRYIEPFAGGAAIALHFAINLNIPVVINDKDPVIYSFWDNILSNTDDFIAQIVNTPIDIEHWQWAHQMVTQKHLIPSFELGFACFYLNRCNFSGCLNARPIGGLRQAGKWNMSDRFNKEKLINRIQKIADHKKFIKATQFDALELLPTLTHDDFVYLDPPYYTQGRFLYNNYFDDNGHDDLSQLLKNSQAQWLMSYDKCDYIENLYIDYPIHDEAVRYSFSKKTYRQEILLSNVSFSLHDA